MRDLINAELYKLYKSAIYKILLLGVIIYAVSDLYAAYTYGDTVNGFQAIIDSTGSWSRSLLISGIFAGMFVAGDFDNRGIQMQLSVGKSRLSVIFAKSFVYWISGILFALLYQIIYIIPYTFTEGFGIKISWEVISLLLQIETAYLFLFSGFLAVCLFIAFILRGLYVVTITEVLFVILLPSVMVSLQRAGGALKIFYLNSPVGKLFGLFQFALTTIEKDGRKTMTFLPPEEILDAFAAQWNNGMWAEMVMGLAMTIVFFLAAYLVFLKADLK